VGNGDLYVNGEKTSLKQISRTVKLVELGLVNCKKWADLIRFIYYKLADAFKKLLALSKLYNPPIFVSDKFDQLCLEPGGI